MRIETQRLIIRNFRFEDEKDLCEYMLQRVDAQFEAYPDFTPDKSRSEIEFRCSGDEFFAIELKREQKVIGNIYLGKREFSARELGYVLNENYFRQGYASEAGEAALKYCWENGVHRVFAETAPQHVASWKTMERIGMKREALFCKNVSFHTDQNNRPIYWDTYVYAILNPYETDLR